MGKLRLALPSSLGALGERGESLGKWLLLLGILALGGLAGLEHFPLTPAEMLYSESARHWWSHFSQSQLHGWDQGLGRSPLMVVLVALGKVLGGDNRWGDRWPMVLLTCGSLPLVYRLGQRWGGNARRAWLTLAVYGSGFGVMYWGRLASRPGLILALTLAYLGSLGFCRRDLRGSLGLGLALGAVSLTDGPTGLLLTITALVFLQWDTPRLLRTGLFWIGLGLGLGPAIAWWGYYAYQYGPWDLWFPLTESLGGDVLGLGLSVPGLVLALPTLRQVPHCLPWSWARLLLCQLGLYSILAIVSPWNHALLLLPLVPPLALAAALALDTVLTNPCPPVYPRWWRQLLWVSSALIAGLGMGLARPSAWVTADFQPWLVLWLILLALTFMMAAHLLGHRPPEAVHVLLWGLFVCGAIAVYSPLHTLFRASSGLGLPG